MPHAHGQRLRQLQLQLQQVSGKRFTTRMGLFWNRRSDGNGDGTGDSGSAGREHTNTLPDDLNEYLQSKESQLSNREFKALLRRQSDNTNAAKEAERDSGLEFLNKVQGKSTTETLSESNQQSLAETEKKNSDAELDVGIPKMLTGISTVQDMKKPKDYLNYELEKYRRENDEKESVLVNCSEIQNAFYSCLGTQSTWDRITAVARLDSDECTKLADFFMACTDIQKKAFLTFDYSTLESVEEMKTASRQVDYTFNKSFKSIDDVNDKEKFLQYSKELRKQRELFFEKFNK